MLKYGDSRWNEDSTLKTPSTEHSIPVKNGQYPNTAVMCGAETEKDAQYGCVT